MSYFPSDIPYMTDNELEEHGINAKREQGMEQVVNEVIVNELTIQFKNLGLIDECINDVKNALVDISKVYKEEQKSIDEAYQRGLQDGKEYREKGCEGCKWEDKEYNICTTCRNSYKNLYERKDADDEIKVGDGLEHTARGGCTSKAIFLEQIGYYDEDWYRCLFWTGCEFTILCYPKSQFKRTGKHYGIDKILEAMKE